MSNLGNRYSFNVVIKDNGVFLIGNSQEFTFAGVKLHLPNMCPLCESNVETGSLMLTRMTH